MIHKAKELIMSRLKKLNVFFITIIFSHSATAVIVEGSVSGKSAASYSTNLTQEQAQTDGVNYIYQQATNYDSKGSSYNIGSLELASQTPALHTGDLVQNLSLLPSATVYDNVVSYAGLESVASRADYHGWVAVNLTATKVDAEEAVTVPEPSSLLLLLGPLLFLLWRMDVFPKSFRKVR
jgi:hypothetical protein